MASDPNATSSAIVTIISLAVAGVLAGVWNFLKSKNQNKDDHPAGKQIVLETASIADMQPIRDIAGSLKELIGEVKILSSAVRDAIEDRKDEEEIERRAEQKAAQIIADRATVRRASTRTR